ncbi:MAG: N-acetylmuramoyl-L-alanine amidase [Candidatus Methylomirabilales bacterium]
MQGKDLRIGILTSGGYLKTEAGEILLARIPIHAAQHPESAVLEIASEHAGQMAMVRGDFSNNVLYSATIVEIIPPVTGSLVKTLINKGIVSFEDIQNRVSESALGERETLDQRKLCALVIGHKKRSPGAVNARVNLTEFDFNEDLALRIEKKVQKVDIQRIYRRTYKELPDDINALNPDFIVSLHCNAFNERVSGTEVLYYYKSERSKKMADIVLKHLVEHLKLPNRGIKPRTAEDRGGYLLRYTKAPCVIAEPFFIDNNDDLDKAQENLDGIAAAYANAIKEVSQSL